MAWSHSGTTPPFLWDHTTRALAPYGAACGTTTARSVAPGGGPSHRSPAGLPLVGRAGPHDAPDGDDEQDRQGDIGADEGHGEAAATTGKAGADAWASGVRRATTGPMRAARTKAARQRV